MVRRALKKRGEGEVAGERLRAIDSLRYARIGEAKEYAKGNKVWSAP